MCHLPAGLEFAFQRRDNAEQAGGGLHSDLRGEDNGLAFVIALWGWCDDDEVGVVLLTLWRGGGRGVSDMNRSVWKNSIKSAPQRRTKR